MSFFQPNIVTNLSSHFDENKWIKQIQQTLDEELEEIDETPVKIFTVPKCLMSINRDCYIPHQVAIGPYHHLRAEVYDMERYKVAAAKRSQKELQNKKFQDIVDTLMKHELRIRASYHRPLNFGCEALAWMMAVDASFLLEFFQVCGAKGSNGKVLAKIPSRLAHLIEMSANKNGHNAILRDITMLENQIPLSVLRLLLEFQYSSIEKADELLTFMLVALSKELLPFKLLDHKIHVHDCAHLLDYLYHCTVPKVELPLEIVTEICEESCEGRGNDGGSDSNSNSNNNNNNNKPFSNPRYVRKLLRKVWRVVPITQIKRLICSRPVKVVATLPWKILTSIPVVSLLKEPIESMFGVIRAGTEKKDDEETGDNRPPLQKQIAMPSVTQLLDAGVRFVPVKEGIASIRFDEKTLTFYLPVVVLDVNSEVVLRNLIAYEATAIPGPLVLARYTELMNGIIDTDLDAEFLCERGIIVSHLKSEKEVAELWNGMSKSIRLTKVPPLDKVIGDVNRFYDGRWNTKCEKFMKERVFRSWRILTFLAAIFLLMLTCLQSFCEVYHCARFTHTNDLDPMVTRS